MRSDGWLVETIEQVRDEAGGFLGGGGGMELGGESYGAEVGVGDGLLDGLGCGCGGADLREVDGGDLEAIEEEAGAAGIELIGGEAMEDLADGGLDGAAVFGIGKGEG